MEVETETFSFDKDLPLDQLPPQLRKLVQQIQFSQQIQNEPMIEHMKWFLDRTEFPKAYIRDPQEDECIVALGNTENKNPIEEYSNYVLLKPFDNRDEKSQDFYFFPWQTPLYSSGMINTRIYLSPKFKNYKDPKLTFDSLIPNKDDYEKIFNLAKEAINQNKLQKVVLARRRRFKIKNQINPTDLLKFLEKNSPESNTYYVAIDKKHYCIGASPEKLFSYNCADQNQVIRVDAVAGTALDQKDLKQKNIQDEHTIVTDFVKEQLSKIVKDVHISEPTVISQYKLYHLKSEISGEATHKPKLEELVDLLHPTPATAGYPQKEAIGFLEQEQFTRGLYSGVLAYQLRFRISAIVLLRGIFVNDGYLDLYTASGIVKDSKLEEEWAELDHKEELLLSYLKPYIVEK